MSEEQVRARLAEGNGANWSKMKMRDGEELVVDGITWMAVDWGYLWWWATVDNWAVKLRQDHRGQELNEPLVWYWSLFCHERDHSVEVYGGIESLEESMRRAVWFVREVGSKMSMRDNAE